ncbi:MAG TPA: hypothetical protein VM779_05390 [Thermoanaerobaculia bacterium]|nr:hypothetical protein [Thermoanaerobaculia bacterium]
MLRYGAEIAAILDREPEPISVVQPLAPPALERVGGDIFAA